MSQCYRIQLKESVSRIVKSSDTITYPIELTEILPEDEMKELMREALLRNGWRDENGILTRTGEAGETISIDLDAMEVTALLEEEREVSTEVQVSGLGQDKHQAEREARAELQEKTQSTGSQLEEMGTNALSRELTGALEESEEGRQRLLNEILQEVYAESLKRKAGQLGDILEVSESTNESGNYELTIRVSQ